MRRVVKQNPIGAPLLGMVVLVAALISPTARCQTVTCCFPQAADPITPDAARSKLTALQEQLRKLYDDEVRREMDPTALAQALDHDLQRMFRFVRDELLFHPYRGALRGGRGALLAGAANDVDRCLLLAELLRSGPDSPNVRFAFGRLTPEAANELAERALRGAPGKSAYHAVDVDALLHRVGKSKQDLAQADLRLGRQAQSYVTDFLQGYSTDSRTIESALARAEVALRGREADSVESHVKRLQHHAWLQVSRGGRWIDLDPSFPKAEMGWRPVKPDRVADSLPSDDHCRLNIKIEVEQLAGDKLRTSVLYQRQFDTIDLAGRSITLTTMPENFKWKNFAAADSKTPPVLAMSSEFDRYQVVVDGFGDREQSRLFDLQGRAFASRDGAFVDLGSITGSRIGRLLGGGGPFGRRRAESTNQLSGLRLELTTIVPGKEPRTDVRYFLDRLKPGTRDAKPVLEERWRDDTRTRLSLVQSWTLWPATGTLNHAFLFDRIYRLVGRDGGADLILELAAGAEQDRWRRIADHVDALPLPVVGVVQTAQQLSQSAFESGKGVCFMAEPSLLLWKESLTLREKKKVGFRRGVDIVSAPLGCVATDVRDAARARMLFGLLLSEGESATLGRHAAEVISAARVCRRAREAGIPLLTLNPDDESDVESLAVAEEAKVRLRGELRRGYVVITPKQAVAVAGRKVTAWWRINPQDGMCLGVGQSGEGQAVSEGMLVLEHISIPMVENVMKFVACFNAGVAGGQSMQQAGSECGMQFMKDYLKQTLEDAIDQFVLDPGFYDYNVGPQATGDGADWLAGTSPGHRGLRESQAISDKMNESGFQQLLNKVRRHYGNYEGMKGLAGRVNLLLTFGNEIAAVASQTQSQ
jgi:hypothetical protein